MKRSCLGVSLVLSLLCLSPSQGLRAQVKGVDPDLKVSPQTLLMDWNTGKEEMTLTIHADINFSTVVRSTVELDGIGAVRTFADNRGDLVAKFDWAAIRDHLMASGRADEQGGSVYLWLTLTCQYMDQDGALRTFSAEDDVRVVY